MRVGMRYLCGIKGSVRCSVGAGSFYRFAMARHFSSLTPSSSSDNNTILPFSSCSQAGAVAASRRFPPLSFFAVCRMANFRLWSSGRRSQDSKDTAPLTDREPASSAPLKSKNDVKNDLVQATEILESHARQSWRQRAKNFALEYGRVGICTHVVLSLLSFSVIYFGVSSGLDVPAFLGSVGLRTPATDSTTNSAGSMLLAYTLYKILAPIRWPLTFAVTPVVLRSLRRRGYMLAAINSPSHQGSPPPR